MHTTLSGIPQPSSFRTSRAPTSPATVRHVVVAVATSRMMFLACASPSFLGTAKLPPRSRRDSEDLRDDPKWIIGLLVVARLLPFRQFDLRARQLLVGNFAQDMREGVQPRPPLIIV